MSYTLLLCSREYIRNILMEHKNLFKRKSKMFYHKQTAENSLSVCPNGAGCRPEGLGAAQT